MEQKQRDAEAAVAEAEAALEAAKNGESPKKSP